MTKLNFARCLLATAWCLTTAACEDDFARFNELEDLRVLAVRASAPTLGAGETAALDALVFLEDGNLSEVDYAWSWCPFLDPSDPRRCWKDASGFAAELSLEDTDIEFDFELGSDSEASFNYPEAWQPLLSELCEQGAAVEGPLGGLLFDCDGGFPLHILLSVSHGDATVVASKTVRLAVSDDDALNENPSLGDTVRFVRIGDADDEPSPPTGESSLLVDGTTIELDNYYRLFVDVDEASAERFLALDPMNDELAKRPERLYITWFISSGETKFARTSLIDGAENALPFDQNTWELPLPGDEDASEASLILVLRDERGGIDWLRRRVELTR